MVKSMILGIDPGAHGAFAFLNKSGKVVEIVDMPTIKVKVNGKDRDRVSSALIVSLLKPYAAEIELAVLEQVGGLTGQSASAAFTFGYSCGMVEGVLSALEIPVKLVTPQTWKKSFGLNKDKGLSRQMAIRLWPEKAELFKRVADADRAEAALIAKWGIGAP